MKYDFVNVENELPDKNGFYTVVLKDGYRDEALFSNGRFYTEYSGQRVILWLRGSLKKC